MSFSKQQKLIFGLLGLFLLLVVVVEGCIIVDQAVTISYMKDGYARTQQQLAAIVSIINNTDLTKSQIEKCLARYSSFIDLDFTGDTIQMHGHELIFNNGKLMKIDPAY